MNRARMNARRRAVERYYASAVEVAIANALGAHSRILSKAMGRIDHHDERLGIVRPVGSWNSK
jgi:hypothetical protein